MANPLDQTIADVNTATDEVAARIDRLTATIATDMTAAQVDEAKAGFKAISDRLHALGQDPVNPVPPPPVAFKNLKA